MRILFCLLIAAGLVGAQDDVETKKKRLGLLIKQMNVLQKEAEALLRELSGGDPEKMNALMREVMEKNAPEMAAEMASAQMAANERNASASLKTLASAEADFRANDRDNNRLQDFWTADVSGLYRVETADGAIRLIEASVAAADAKPCVPLDKAGALPDGTKLALLGKGAPKAGYRYVALQKDAEARYDEGKGRANARFGFCAYPAEYGKSGRRSFLLNENNTIFAKDTGGKPVEAFPQDPAREGWKKLD